MVAKKATGFDWAIENQRAFESKLDELGKATSDFRIPFGLISMDWYRSNRKLFTLQSKGLYQDLSPSRGEDGNPTTTSNYKDQKLKDVGFIYPILVGKTGRLSSSILNKGHKDAVLFIGRKELQMGSSTPYAKYHQSDAARSKIPQRKFIFIDGGPADKSSDSSINGRRERWLNIIDTHISQLVTGGI